MSIQKAIESYVQEHPLLLETFQEGLINYSALCRKIIKETALRTKDFDAILIALRRAKEKLKKNTKIRRDLTHILRNSTINVRNKVAVMILDKDTPLYRLTKIIEKVEKEEEQVSVVQTHNAVTMMLHERFHPLFKDLKPHIQRTNTDVVAITIESPENLEVVPGFIAHLTSLLASKGINIVELTSCYTDTIILVQHTDVERAISVIGF